MQVTQNKATIEVEGDMARHVATSVLDALGVESEDVQQLQVVLRTISEANIDVESTNTSFQTSGPNAGDLATSMLGSVDNQEHVPEYIHVEVTTQATADADNDDATQTADESAEPTGDGHSDRQERVMPDDFATEDSPATAVERLTEGSLPHQALAALAAYEANHSAADGATVEDIYEGVDHDISTQSTLSSALSTIFRQKGYLDRTRETPADSGGVRCRYWMDDDAWDELDRLGWPDSVQEPSTDAGETPAIES